MEQKKEDKKHSEAKKPAEETKETSEVESLKKQIEEKSHKIDELTDTLKRLQAEFENFKKRTEKEKSEFMKYSSAMIISQILPVLDSFEIALKNASDKEKFIDGMKMIYAQLHSVLEKEGLRPIHAAGGIFDPYKHEVLMKEESDKPEGTILEEFQKGYMLNDKVLRFSKVKISGK
ncbi:nucleotide exchange factor GrpE [Candidatus Woesearchaeota archaeon]|nr:nucleotide exchange factor GrpE [Candidatus Woesearchaeota archaeon]MBI2107922.1 nucleotide exchange factor GrpE [Candidatus Woesearchaeota archaeon]